ncbi:MAG: glyoxylate/hydroxypyruvate reductase A [Saprospiraceae bacterium]|nr:glyoxylate/hydroxypyruvate reductase A [Saprospiraceae bacterium]
MSIVIIFNNKDPKPWANILQQKLPDVNIDIYPNVKNKENVVFALCWKPEKGVLAQFPNLSVVQSVGASVDNVINGQQIGAHIAVTRIVDPQLTADMFEYLLTGIMNYLKNTNAYFLDKNHKIWQQKPYKTIPNTTVCVLGLGELGAYAATKLSALGFKTKGWSKSEKNLPNIACFHGKNGLKQALKGTDVLINLLPFTTETENILGLDNLKRLNKGGFLINVGRGQHLVDDDLIHLLENQHLSGALLDVFREEPLPENHPFWHNEKITITPHVASLTNVGTASNGVVENYRRFQRKEKLLNVVSVSKGY